MTDSVLTYALWYASRGWRVLPVCTVLEGRCSCRQGSGCTKPGKHPHVRAWQDVATTDEKVISNWWRHWPTANVAVATGQKSGVFVVDVDGEAGQATLSSLKQDHGWVPKTASVRTGNGLHLYFSSPQEPVKSRTGIMPGLDVRGEGGYVVAPPSLHVRGSAYTWQSDDAVEDAPEWLIDLVNGGSRTHAQTVQAHDGEDVLIPVGERNDTLYRLACGLKERGLEVDEIEKELFMVNENGCEEPLPNGEVKSIAASAGTRPKGRTASRTARDESFLRYFPFNIVEWMTDDLIVTMTDAQRGRYINLLAACWPKGGILPSDPKILYKLSRASCTPNQFSKEMEEVMAPFQFLPEDGGFYRHPKLAEEFEKSNAVYKQRVEAGRKSWACKQEDGRGVAPPSGKASDDSGSRAPIRRDDPGRKGAA